MRQKALYNIHTSPENQAHALKVDDATLKNNGNWVIFHIPGLY